MENASKALIIAGAILLAILIISLGILIYNQASSVANNNGMSEVDASSFNQKFTQYEGTVKGSTVRSLLQAVLSSNMQEDNEDRLISVDGAVTMNKDSDSAPTQEINAGKSYSVQCNYSNSGANKGLVNSITITAINK